MRILVLFFNFNREPKSKAIASRLPWCFFLGIRATRLLAACRLQPTECARPGQGGYKCAVCGLVGADKDIPCKKCRMKRPVDFQPGEAEKAAIAEKQARNAKSNAKHSAKNSAELHATKSQLKKSRQNKKRETVKKTRYLSPRPVLFDSTHSSTID